MTPRQSLFYCELKGVFMKLSFVFILLFSMNAFSQVMPADQIMGRWKTKNPIYNSGTAITSFFNFKPNALAVKAACQFQDGAQLEAQVKVAVVYHGTDVYIQETQSSIKEDGLRYCRVHLTQTKWSFYFNALGEAVLIAAVPYGMQFQLIRY